MPDLRFYRKRRLQCVPRCQKEGYQDAGRRRTLGKTKETCHAVKEKAATRAGTPEVTRVEMEVSRSETHGFRTHPFANRETLTTIVLTV
jgi:hypothetical protein